MIIGITGTIGAGKGTAVEIISRFGFTHFSARGLLEEELAKRGKPFLRVHMTDLADEWRKEKSPGYIVEELLRRAAAKGGNAIVESIRSLGEIESLRQIAPEGILLAIDAPQNIRYERILKRKASTDNVSFEQFCAEEQRESEGTDPWRGNLPGCIKKADAVIENSGDMEEFEKNIISFLQKYGIN